MIENPKLVFRSCPIGCACWPLSWRTSGFPLGFQGKRFGRQQHGLALHQAAIAHCHCHGAHLRHEALACG
jgi:hypothetical protein